MDHDRSEPVRASPPAAGDQPLPHPTDRAVVAAGADAATTVDEGANGWRLVRELPFEPGRGFHAVLGELPEGRLISVKARPTRSWPAAWRGRRCDGPGDVRPLASVDQRRLEAEVEQLAAQGLRVLAVAERPASPRRRLDEDRIERLKFRGLLGLADKVRPTAAEAVDRAAPIRDRRGNDHR